MNFTRQFLALLGMNLGALGARLGSVLTILIGVGCTVGVLVSMLAMGTGAHRQALADVHDDVAAVTSQGTRGFLSNIPRAEVEAVRDSPGIARTKDGEPIVVASFVVPIDARRRGTGRRIFFLLAGSTMTFMDMHPEVMHFTAGRLFRPGLHELIASNPCVRQFTGFELGDKRQVRGSDWTIVGHFDQGHNTMCMVITDAETLMTTFASNAFTNLEVELASPHDYDAFRKAVESNPALHLEVKHDREMREENFKQFNALLKFAAYFVGGIMAVGATLGAVNSLYSIVDARRRELATLRAIGFSPLAVATSTLAESILLALPGALAGSALAWLFFHDMAVSPFGFSFQLDVTPALALIGITWALLMGLIGGVLPAVRAGRVSVTAALRAT
jgi:putative ABC transport system permease protein